MDESCDWIDDIKHFYTIETILKFLYDHVERSADLQARVKWAPGTVVLWDNRVTAHVSGLVLSMCQRGEVLLN